MRINNRHPGKTVLIEPLESRIVPSFFVASTSPQNGGVVGASPTFIDVIFSDAVAAATVQASDFRIDGIAATNYSFLTPTLIRVNIPSPIFQGVHDISLAANSILDSGGVPIVGYVGYFTVDTTAPRVVSSSIQPNATLSGSSLSYQVRFDEPMSTGAFESGDFSLRGNNLNVTYAPASFGFDAAADTLTIQFNNLPTDNYTLTLISGNNRFEDRAGNDLDGEIFGYPLPTNASGNGIAGGNTVIPFSLEGMEPPFPAFQEIAPFGSLAFQSSVFTTFSAGDPGDTFDINFVAGQNIQIIASPSASLNPTITLHDSDGDVVATGTGILAGNKLVLSGIVAPASGTYKVTLGSVGGSIGTSTIQVLVNSGLENENFGGSNNNNIGNAQSLEGDFISIGGGAMVQTIQGIADVSVGVLPNETEPNNFPFEANVATYNFTAYNGNLYQLGLQGDISTSGDLDYYNIGTLQVGDVITITQSSSSTSRGTLGDSYVTLFRGPAATPVLVEEDDDGGPGLDSIIHRYTITTEDTYYIESAAFSTGTGTYQIAAFLENSGTAPVTGTTITSETETNNTANTATDVSSAWRAVQYLSHTTAATQTGSSDHFRYEFTAGDLVTVYIDSLSAFDTNVSLLDANGVTIASEDGTSDGLGLDSPIYGFRIPSTGAYYVKASGTGTFDAYAADVYLSSSTHPPSPGGNDFYSFELSAGETASVALKLATAGAAQVQIQDAAGTTLATGVTSHTNSNSVIHNFTPPSSGTYYVKVNGTAGINYNLLTLLNGDFDSEANDSFATAQNLGSSVSVLGHMAAAPTNKDFYTFSATEAGSTLIISTDTLTAALNAGVNLLDTTLELYNSSGTLVASDDNSAADGVNAVLHYTVPSPGTYTVAVSGKSLGGHYLLNVLGTSTANDAPVLGSGNATMSVIEDDSDGHAVLISDLIASGGSNFVADPDAGALQGLAIVGVDDSFGTWEFSTDGGTNWISMGAPTPANARLLGDDASVRFIPTPDFHGTIPNGISFVAWDQTSGVNGEEASTLLNGAATAFSTATAYAELVVTPLNDEPAFLKGADQESNEDSGLITVSGWATALSVGSLNETGQLLTFEVTNDNNSLFAIQPAVSANGVLTYTPAVNAVGMATVSVILHDSGGTMNGGDDTTAAQTFTIQINPINDQPSFVIGANQTLNEDSGLVTIPGWASAISPGPADESAQLLTFEVTNDDNSLFVIQPALSANGTLVYTLADNAVGTATISVTLHDSGDTLNGGDNSSATQTFTIQINPVNDAPTFLIGADQTTNEDSGSITLPAWATAITPGPSDEFSQTATFTVTNDNNPLFSIQPAIAPDGTLSYTLAGNAYGSATVSVTLQDNGGTADGGDDTSTTQNFTIEVGPMNDGPVNSIPGSQQTREIAPLIFSTSNGNGLTIFDMDAGISNLSVGLSATNGTLTLGAIAGLTFTTGDGAGDSNMVFEGSLSDINTALQNLTFLPAIDFNGIAALQISTNDLGNTGGGSLTDTDTISILVTPVIHFTKKATYTDADGDIVTVSLRGGGSGEIWLPAQGAANADAIVLQNTTAKSSLQISTKRGHETTIHDIIVNGDIKSIAARSTDLTGLLEVTGRLASLRLDDVLGGDISLRTDTSSLLNSRHKVSLILDQVTDSTIETNDLRIQTLRTTEWLDTDANDTITAPAIARLIAAGRTGIQGDFHASLDLTGSAPRTKTLGSASIKGNVGSDADTPVTWDIAGQAGTIKLRGDALGWDITVRDNNGIAGSLSSLQLKNATALDLNVDGNIGTVIVGGLHDSNIFAGVSSGVNGLPGSGDFSLDAKIGKLVIAGIPNVEENFGSSNVASSQIGSVTLKGIQTENGGVPFGIAAHSIARLIVSHSGETQRFSKLTEIATIRSIDDFVARIV